MTKQIWSRSLQRLSLLPRGLGDFIRGRRQPRLLRPPVTASQTFGVGAWPLALAMSWFSVPLAYMALSFQLQWHDVGHVRNVLNNLVAMGQLYSIEWQADHMAIHFTPLLYLIAPFVHVFNSLSFFLILHAAALALASAFFYQFCRCFWADDRICWAAWALFLFNPLIVSGNLSVHFEVFGIVGLMAFAAFAAQGRVRTACGALLLCVMAKEDYWLYAAAASVLLSRNIPRRQSALYLGIACFYGILIVGLVYPHLYPAHVDRFADLWSYGKTKADVAIYLMEHLGQSAGKLVKDASLSLNVTFLFLPLLLGWRFIPTVCLLFLWVNSTSEPRASLAYYYGLPLASLYLLSLPESLRALTSFVAKLNSKLKRPFPSLNDYRVGLGVTALLCAIALVQVFRPGQSARHSILRQTFNPTLKMQKMAQLEQLFATRLSESTSVLTSFTLSAYVPPRPDLFIAFLHADQVLNGSLRPDLVILDTSVSDVFFDEERSARLLQFLRASPAYTEFPEEGFLLFARK